MYILSVQTAHANDAVAGIGSECEQCGFDSN